MTLKIKVKILGNGADLPLPAYESQAAAGVDLRAALKDGPVWLQPMQRMAVPTGLSLSIPAGYEAQIRPRSGLALREGITVANAPGTIDSDYRGEIKILLVNLGAAAFEITHGMRVAQMVFAPVVQAEFSITEQLDETQRGEAGFGSTGR